MVWMDFLAGLGILVGLAFLGLVLAAVTFAVGSSDKCWGYKG